MALPAFPQSVADFVAALTDEDFVNGGHRTNFIPTAQGALTFAEYARLVGLALLELAEQVEVDAASAAAGSGTEASLANIWSGLSANYLSIRRVYEANAIVPLADAAAIAVNLGGGINFGVTLAGNRTLANPDNAVAGQSGFIVVNQDAAGGRTLAKASNWKVAGGSVVLDQAPGAKSVLSYFVESPTSVLLTVSEAFS
jgi:hypothetical protein